MANNLQEAPPIVNLSYKKGDLIIKEGDYGVSIYKILRGEVSVFRESEGAEIPLATLGEGDIFGERIFLNRAGQTRSTSVRAIRDTRVEAWHMKRLSREYENMPPIIKHIIDQVMSRSIRMNNLIVQLTTRQQKEEAKREKEHPLASKRRFYRKKVDLSCRYRPLSASSKFNLDGTIEDISLDGLAINVTKRNTIDISHEEGDIFVVQTVLPNNKDVVLEARVVSARQSETPDNLRINMLITDISAGTKKTLGFFLMP